MPPEDKGGGQRHRPSSGRTALQTPHHQGRARAIGDMMADAGLQISDQAAARSPMLEVLHLRSCRPLQPSGMTGAVTGKRRVNE